MRSPRRSALDHEAIGRGEAAAHQRLGHRDEVGERVLLLQQLAGVVPGAPRSPPPRTCAMAKIIPRSSSEMRDDEKYGSIGKPYEP
jgi:hypothetical protein